MHEDEFDQSDVDFARIVRRLDESASARDPHPLLSAFGKMVGIALGMALVVFIFTALVWATWGMVRQMARWAG